MLPGKIGPQHLLEKKLSAATLCPSKLRENRSSPGTVPVPQCRELGVRHQQ